MNRDLLRQIAELRERGQRAARDAAPAPAHRLRALHRTALALAEPLPPGHDAIVRLLGTIAACAQEALGSASAHLVLREDPAWAELLPGSDPHEGRIVVSEDGRIRRKPQRAGGPVEHVLTTGEPVYVTDILSPSPFGPFPDRARRTHRAFAVSPLRAGGQLLGAFSVDFAATKELTEEEREALDLFSAHAGAALERARVLSEERRREARFRALVEHSRDAIMLVDERGAILYVSPGRMRLLGYDPDERVGADAFDIVHPEDVAGMRRRFGELLRRPGATDTAVVRCRHREGSWVWIEATGTNLLHEPVVGAVVVNYRDVGARKHAEEQHAERLRLDGALLVARTVAHELNNSLSPVTGYAQLLAARPEIATRPDLARQVASIAQAAEQAAETIRRLQHITRLEEHETPLAPRELPILDLERSTTPADTADTTGTVDPAAI